MATSKRKPVRKPSRSGNPAARAAAASGTGVQPVRRGGPARAGRPSGLESRFAGFVRFLSRQPPYVFLGMMIALMLVGLAAPLWAAIPALLVIMGVLGLLAVLAWRVITPGQRVVRLVGLAVLLVALVGRVAGWF